MIGLFWLQISIYVRDWPRRGCEPIWLIIGCIVHVTFSANQNSSWLKTAMRNKHGSHYNLYPNSQINISLKTLHCTPQISYQSLFMILYITHLHDFSLHYLHYWRCIHRLTMLLTAPLARSDRTIWYSRSIYTNFYRFLTLLSPHCLLKYCLLLFITKTPSMITVFPLRLVSFSNIIWWNQLHRYNFYFSCYFLLSNAATIKISSQIIHCHLSPQSCVACKPYRSVYLL